MEMKHNPRLQTWARNDFDGLFRRRLAHLFRSIRVVLFDDIIKM